jgi:poly-gamma-glutamate synthesis protein (capsule biosynthesis protein)
VGNFFSNQRDRYRDGGIIFELNIQKITRTDITSVGFVPVWVYKGWYNERIIYRLIPPAKFEETLEKYNISNSDSIKCTDFYNDTREHLGNLKEINITE